ncbi:MAG TPA: NAD(P)H-quinone oxidoreductase [Planctomycetota bacterium]|nr:NAD(P)H-quinone oxidoreductase [Planctomycetota bacterium]
MPTGTSRYAARCVRIAAPGGPEVLAPGSRLLRAPQRGELLVEVAACGVNRADILQRQGHYPAPPDVPPDVPGLEYAGTIAEVGADAVGPLGQRWRAGERVMGLVGGGALSSLLLAPADQALPVPERLSLEQAAATPEAFLTAWDALVLQARLRAGEVVLVHAAGSGVGTAALQLARARGATVAGTSRTAEKLERCRALGLQHALTVARADRQTPARFAEALLAATGGRPADVILDVVGAAYLDENLRALAPRGRMVCLGLLGGATATLPLGRLLERRAHLMGSTLRNRPDEEKAALASAFCAQVLPALADGRLAPVVDAVLPVSEVRAAHERVERGEVFGKLVLRW